MTHVVLEGLDGARLDTDHGAPVRLVSPAQYGYISTKHLSRMELHGSEPTMRYHPPGAPTSASSWSNPILMLAFGRRSGTGISRAAWSAPSTTG